MKTNIFLFFNTILSALIAASFFALPLGFFLSLILNMREQLLPYIIVYTGFTPIILFIVLDELNSNRRRNMFTEKQNFKNIVSQICKLYQNENYKEEINRLEKIFYEKGYKANFRLIENNDPELDIDFSSFFSNNKYVFVAEIDLTQGNSAPYTIIKWEETIERLIYFIKENSESISKELKL